jgi:hypothetical protein
MPHGPAELRIRELRLALPGRQLFDSAELTIERGARVLLVGPPESGKSTLLDLLFGLRRADHGSLLIDGYDVRELPRAVLRERVAIVRGPEIVSGSVLDNVTLGRPGVGAGAVRALLERIGLADESRAPAGRPRDAARSGRRAAQRQPGAAADAGSRAAARTRPARDRRGRDRARLEAPCARDGRAHVRARAVHVAPGRRRGGGLVWRSFNGFPPQLETPPGLEKTHRERVPS